MSFVLDVGSLKKMQGVHPDLQRVITLAASKSSVTFIVTEGLRTVARQEQLVKSGASTTMKSRHLTGHAVDLAAKIGTEVRWDWPLYYKIADAVKEAAKELGVPIEWGGDWKTFKDGPHFQLPFSTYP